MAYTTQMGARSSKISRGVIMFKFIKNIIKQLQCKHQYKFLFSYLIDTGMRKVCVFECQECEKIKVYIV